MNALLQLKANLFLALEKSRNVKIESLTEDLILANRRYAAAARTLANQPEDVEAILELEAALLSREQIERIDLPYAENQIAPFPGAARVLMNDFVSSKNEGTVQLDYTLLRFQPPRHGLIGPALGWRYIGIRIAKGTCRIVDLGEAGEIEAVAPAGDSGILDAANSR